LGGLIDELPQDLFDYRSRPGVGLVPLIRDVKDRRAEDRAELRGRFFRADRAEAGLDQQRLAAPSRALNEDAGIRPVTSLLLLSS
jgi:hypothetical protein